ncbi:hypothetical protein OPLHCY645_07190 [Clostridium tetani]
MSFISRVIIPKLYPRFSKLPPKFSTAILIFSGAKLYITVNSTFPLKTSSFCDNSASLFKIVEGTFPKRFNNPFASILISP